MKVILLKKNNNLGKKFEEIDVKPGYGRNFLLPKRYVIIATNSVRKKIIEFKKKIIQNKIKNLKKIFFFLKKKKKIEITFYLKLGKNGKLLGSITKKNIKKIFFLKKNKIKKIFLEKRKINKIGIFNGYFNLPYKIKYKFLFKIFYY
ncbi:50S ribosomal protein L9 [Candidatus Karelsulcia muelleri]|uniref:Large ribosomal subunit protein bL9 n=1 Tax=Candidatus Karelsulcia muelleri PSPU TaxID=1189303 RepID=A0AAD1AZ97_9FLAO|nr:50S ribosomal protein L9 [Candidatus Karelsulcia muelleri]NJJ98684.1 50S ribosomal protein L9 [Candidatus Karelsulcia muelleri]BAO66337.1 50S ribosomal protein L9 [Candidatus Karelsulcia muelleri PSPU]